MNKRRTTTMTTKQNSSREPNQLALTLLNWIARAAFAIPANNSGAPKQTSATLGRQLTVAVAPQSSHLSRPDMMEQTARSAVFFRGTQDDPRCE